MPRLHNREAGSLPETSDDLQRKPVRAARFWGGSRFRVHVQDDPFKASTITTALKTFLKEFLDA